MGKIYSVTNFDSVVCVMIRELAARILHDHYILNEEVVYGVNVQVARMLRA